MQAEPHAQSRSHHPPTPTPKPEDKPSEGGQGGSGTNATPAPTAAPSASAQTGDGFRPAVQVLVGGGDPAGEFCVVRLLGMGGGALGTA